MKHYWLGHGFQMKEFGFEAVFQRPEMTSLTYSLEDNDKEADLPLKDSEKGSPRRSCES